MTSPTAVRCGAAEVLAEGDAGEAEDAEASGEVGDGEFGGAELGVPGSSLEEEGRRRWRR